MLGMRIAALRRKAGMSQRALAKYLCVSASAIGMYEQGRREPSADRLVAMAQLFHVSTDYLLTGVAIDQQDDAAVQQLFHAAQQVAAPYTLHRPDGVDIALSPDEIATLLVAFLGTS